MGNDKISALAAMPVADVATALEFPLERWPGNCFAVAVALVESGLLPTGSRAVYGHWRGPIAAASPFASRAGIGFTGHGWVLTSEDQVIDPTRWVFEAAAPYIYIGADAEESIEEVCRACEHLVDEHEGSFGGRCSGGDLAGYDCGDCYFEPKISAKAAAESRDYDEGGNVFATQQRKPFPAAQPGEPTTATAPPATVALVLRDLGSPQVPGPLTVAQANWAANLPPAVLGPAAAPLYEWLDAEGRSGLIPIDNRFAVLGGSPTAA